MLESLPQFQSKHWPVIWKRIVCDLEHAKKGRAGRALCSVS